MAIIEKIKKFVKDITPPSGEQKAKIEEKQMKVEEMKDPNAYRKTKLCMIQVQKLKSLMIITNMVAKYLQLLNVLMVVLFVERQEHNESLSWYG